MKDPLDNVPALIAQSIEEAVKKAVEEAVKKAAADVEQQVRRQVGAISANVLSYFTFEHNGHDLRITVKFEKP